jgi:hypothetical protein
VSCLQTSNTLYIIVDTDVALGGSFGVVYKGIEKATGETVAIKHVSRGWTVQGFHAPRRLSRDCADRPRVQR